MTRQNQKSGDNSTNIQAENITVHQGVSVTEARQLALDVFKANFFELAGGAREVARKRAEEITEEFLNKLQAENAVGLNQSEEPDFQHALFTVQKEYARCGDEALGELLVDLLVDRTKEPSRSILQIVLNESLAVAPKLTPDQLAVLSLIFLFKYTIYNGIRSQQSLREYLEKFVTPFAPLISPKDACYQHLEYSGCGTVGIGSTNLPEIFRKNYGGIFSKGFDDSQRQAKTLSNPESHAMFVRCLNDENRVQVNGLNEGNIRSECVRLAVSEDDASKLVALHNETLMAQEEVKQHVVEACDIMQGVFEVWNDSKMANLSLTSVGIAIGHANVKKNLGEFTDLAIWIN